MSLFQPREQYRPYEYPSLLGYRDAIRESYWLHTEYNFSSDVHDYRTADPSLKRLVERCLLAISQVEVAVKTFWGRLYEYLPKPEILEVGSTFAESEVRHANAYAHLLDLLGLNERFGELIKKPPFTDRANQLRAASQLLSKASGDNLPRQVITSIALFSIFVEYVSLFSQFYVLMVLNKRANQYRGISNAIAATSKEEHIHADFGFELVKLIRNEIGMGQDELYGLIEPYIQASYRVERDMVEWILGDVEKTTGGMITVGEVDNFVRHRFQQACRRLSIPSTISPPVDYRPPDWFDLELVADKEVDFFAVKPVSYSRNRVAYAAEMLF